MKNQKVILSAKQVSKSFAGENKTLKTVLQGTSLDIREGELVSILGQSGAGKSTLLRMFAGLVFPDLGSLYMEGQPITGPCADVSMVFQSYALYPWLNVYDNIAFGLIARNIPTQQIDKKIKLLLDLVGLTGYEKNWPRELSGGMRQRVGFARALAVEPKVLLLDEPFSSLDIFTAQQLRSDLMTIWTSKKINTSAMVMVTHDVEEAVMMSDRVVILDASSKLVSDDIAINIPREDRTKHNMEPMIAEVSAKLYKKISQAKRDAYTH